MTALGQQSHPSNATASSRRAPTALDSPAVSGSLQSIYSQAQWPPGVSSSRCGGPQIWLCPGVTSSGVSTFRHDAALCTCVQMDPPPEPTSPTLAQGFLVTELPPVSGGGAHPVRLVLSQPLPQVDRPTGQPSSLSSARAWACPTGDGWTDRG